jgi:uncharacterized protein
MIGTILNVAGILIGGIIGLSRPKLLSPARESFFKTALIVFTVWSGLSLTWQSVNGSFLSVLKQLLIAVLALILGKLTGRLLRLQKLSNRLGQTARLRIMAAGAGKPRVSGDGFKACAVLFCAAPLGILGAVQDGLINYFYPLGIKGVMDGLATMGFVALFGRSVMFSAVPVLALQGALTLVCACFLKPWLEAHGLLDATNAAGGALVFSVALVMMGLKRIELTDYLPSLAFAPLLAWVWR